ncbi:MAG: hypothetical protein HQL30_11650 [Candidatus Omnitrophica bacterium]|nr:hypothetical protein [Candidatus Omnitrophota bacterium]
MKKNLRIVGLVTMAVFAAATIFSADRSAARQQYEEDLTSNPKLDEANKLYKKAIVSIKEGDSVHEPQRAAKFYADGESYLRRAVAQLGESGSKNAIDVSKEIDHCEKLEKETHSKQGAAKRETE